MLSVDSKFDSLSTKKKNSIFFFSAKIIFIAEKFEIVPLFKNNFEMDVIW